MARQNGVLEMGDGHEYLTFPGPGGYSIEWSPGTKRYALERAISGHLLLPCDEFDKVAPKKSGLIEPMTTFYTGNLDKKRPEYREMATQTEAETVSVKVKRVHNGTQATFQASQVA
jgi:hypothetical protein